MNCVFLLVFPPSQICSQTEPALSGRYGHNESKAGTKSALTPLFVHEQQPFTLRCFFMSLPVAAATGCLYFLTPYVGV